jgi:hypothetical protein
MLVGLLERLGLRIDLALNIPSIAGLFLTTILIFLLSKRLFSSRIPGILAIIFLFFNGSLSFLRYFSKFGWSVSSWLNIPTTLHFPSFGPWDGSPVGAYWSLNIFTNQRHLAPSLCLALLAIYLLVSLPQNLKHRVKIGLLVGVIASTLMLANQAIFACLAVFLFAIFVSIPLSRLSLLASIVTILPGLIISNSLIHLDPPFIVRQLQDFLANQITVNQLRDSVFKDFGFLQPPPITWSSFIIYWFHNFGLHLLLFPLGFILSPRKAKWLIFPIGIIFFIVVSFRLSPDMFNNHKLLNFIVIFVHLYSGYFIYKMSKLILFRPLIPVLLILLTLSGVIDFFAVKNESKGGLEDIRANPDVSFFFDHTKPQDIVLNSTWFYHPASLAGRSIFAGYSYFTWSHGYDQSAREKDQISIYRSRSKQEACNLLKKHSISYVELSKSPENYLQPNVALWNSEFIPVYSSPRGSIKVYSVSENCDL